MPTPDTPEIPRHIVGYGWTGLDTLGATMVLFLEKTRISGALWRVLEGRLEERVGFEPTVPSLAQRFSRPSQSTTLAPLLRGGPSGQAALCATGRRRRV